MPEYRVKWEVDLIANSPEDAARQALEIQRDLGSVASVFTVTDEDGKVTEIDAID